MKIKEERIVLIIGNGFDLDLGLKTSYKDFINSDFFKLSKDEIGLAGYLAKLKDITIWVDLEEALADYAYKGNNNKSMRYSKKIDDLNNEKAQYQLFIDIIPKLTNQAIEALRQNLFGDNIANSLFISFFLPFFLPIVIESLSDQYIEALAKDLNINSTTQSGMIVDKNIDGMSKIDKWVEKFCNNSIRQKVALALANKIAPNHKSSAADIEMELTNRVKAIEKKIQEYESVSNNSDIQGIKLPDVDKICYQRLVSMLRKFIKNAEDTVKIKKDSKAAKILDALSRMNVGNIFSYNYTSFENITAKAGEQIGNSFPECEYIHGTIKDNNIIIGVGDECDLNETYDFMYKSYNQAYESHNIQYALRGASTVIFFGLSFGDSDWHYFNDFFLNQSQPNMDESDKKAILIFTYNEESRIQILRKLRNKLDRADHGQKFSYLLANNSFKIFTSKDNTDFSQYIV